MEEINKRCISRKEYLKKYDSNVGYALYVQDNIRKDDYVRLNTGNIVKVIGIKANTVNKRAIYYGFFKQDWFDSAAVENFSDNIIDLIEVGDYVNGYKTINIIKNKINNNKLIAAGNMDYEFETVKELTETNGIKLLGNKDIKTILTKESYMANCYKVGGEDE